MTYKKHTIIHAAPAISAFLRPTFWTTHNPAMVVATLTVPRMICVTKLSLKPVDLKTVVPEVS